jgi:hypothetical protein
MVEFTLTERTEPFTLKEVLDFIDDTNISKIDAHELKSRIVDVVLDSEDRVIDEFAKRIIELDGEFPTVEDEFGELRPMTINEMCNVIAEKMKKGV